MSRLVKFFFSKEGQINKYQFNLGVCGILLFTMIFAPAMFEVATDALLMTGKEFGMIADEASAYVYFSSLFFWVTLGILYYSILVLMKKRYADLKVNKELKNLVLAPFVHQTWSTLYDRAP